MDSADTVICLINTFCTESSISILPGCCSSASCSLVACRYNKVWRLGLRIQQVAARTRFCYALVP